MRFDRAYYDGIWPTQGVHRHDYCETLASQLVAQYGKVRILDVGTGCGRLVTELLARGAQAWGLEISEYALHNSCSPWVFRGDVRAIPFRDGRFDVIHSQGLWEYIPESDVASAIAECKRVGRSQQHTIDTSECTILPEHQMVTVKPRVWWDEQFERV